MARPPRPMVYVNPIPVAPSDVSMIAVTSSSSLKVWVASSSASSLGMPYSPVSTLVMVDICGIARVGSDISVVADKCFHRRFVGDSGPLLVSLGHDHNVETATFVFVRVVRTTPQRSAR
ncbi:hypothetical protein ACFQL0_15795 [Haloplanus litoreus]|uniref:hypothetical protein n=1 Tax=Haloplanus litoreus TaxID=767515 RepID=UPI00361BEE53